MDRDEVKYTIRNCILGFKCDANWDLMAVISETDNLDDEISEIRFCNSCQKEVYESNNDEQLNENIRLNRCVSFVRLENDRVFTRLTGDTVHRFDE
jgi:hypothetical protein